MPMEAASGYFEHDADIGIVGRGTTVEEAFVSAEWRFEISALGAKATDGAAGRAGSHGARALCEAPR